jgi:hypothetical protein
MLPFRALMFIRFASEMRWISVASWSASLLTRNPNAVRTKSLKIGSGAAERAARSWRICASTDPSFISQKAPPQRTDSKTQLLLHGTKRTKC